MAALFEKLTGQPNSQRGIDGGPRTGHHSLHGERRRPQEARPAGEDRLQGPDPALGPRPFVCTNLAQRPIRAHKGSGGVRGRVRVPPRCEPGVMGKDMAVADMARRQHGLVTRRQARLCGLTDDQISVRLATGRWLAVRRNVLLINGTPPSWEQTIRAACLATGDVAVASGLTAGRLWGFRLPDPEEIDLTTPMGRQIRLEGVRHHRRSNLTPADLALWRGIPVTSPARTLIDASGLVSPGRLGSVVDDATRRKLVILSDLRACHDRVDTGSGRRAVLALRHVLAERHPDYDPGGSDRELWVKQVLMAAGLPAPVQQHRVRIGCQTFKLDLAYPAEMVGLEFDGWDVHRTFTAFHADRRRTRSLVASGWTMLPVTSRTDPVDLVRDVRATLALCVHEPGVETDSCTQSR